MIERVLLITGLLAMVLAGASAAAFWEIFGLQLTAGTVLGYVGGYVGAQVASLVVQALGVGLVDGVLAPILAAYVGYAVGATVGAWAGVTWTGWHFGLQDDPLRGFWVPFLGRVSPFFLPPLPTGDGPFISRHLLLP